MYKNSLKYEIKIYPYEIIKQKKLLVDTYNLSIRNKRSFLPFEGTLKCLYYYELVGFGKKDYALKSNMLIQLNNVVDDIINFIKDNNVHLAVRVLGYADKIPYRYNEELSIKRARAVAERILDQVLFYHRDYYNMINSVIKFEGKGDTKDKRSVEIVIESVESD